MSAVWSASEGLLSSLDALGGTPSSVDSLGGAEVVEERMLLSGSTIGLPKVPPEDVGRIRS